MYSLVLMMAMTSGEHVPQGILFHRGGCSGIHPLQTAASIAAHAAAAVRSRVAARPHLVGKVVVKTAETVRGAAGTGCSGGRRAVVTRSTTRTVIRGSASGASAPCPNGVCPINPAPYLPLPQPPDAGASKELAGPIGNLITRRAVHKQLRVALSDESRLTPKQREAAQKLLAHPKAYNEAVRQTRFILADKVGAVPPGNVAAFGDGKILQLIIDNLPQIMAAVMEILKAFGIG